MGQNFSNQDALAKQVGPQVNRLQSIISNLNNVFERNGLTNVVASEHNQQVQLEGQQAANMAAQDEIENHIVPSGYPNGQAYNNQGPDPPVATE